ncbi:MAG: hypothetical protein ACTHQQ_09025 [Solirubrobacteraceae bacterium]
MPRQRVRIRVLPAATFARALVVLLGLALVWYGAMVILLAAKVSPHTVNSISAYRTIYDTLSGLRPVTGIERAIIAGAGLIVFLIAGYLALKALPRPYLARHDLKIDEDKRGRTVVEPRTIERIAEATANRHAAVKASRGRYALDGLNIDLTVERPDTVSETLGVVQTRVTQAIEAHHLPAVAITVTLAGYEPSNGRKLE